MVYKPTNMFENKFIYFGRQTSSTKTIEHLYFLCKISLSKVAKFYEYFKLYFLMFVEIDKEKAIWADRRSALEVTKGRAWRIESRAQLELVTWSADDSFPSDGCRISSLRRFEGLTGIHFSSRYKNPTESNITVALGLFLGEPLDSETGAAGGVDDERARNFIHRGHFGLLDDHPDRR